MSDNRISAATDAQRMGLAFVRDWTRAEQPSPYSGDGYPPPGLVERIEARVSAQLDLAAAFDELEQWITRAPSERSCWAIDKMHGKWRVGLQSGDERYSASQDAELRGAIRNAIAIATMAGCL